MTPYMILKYGNVISYPTNVIRTDFPLRISTADGTWLSTVVETVVVQETAGLVLLKTEVEKHMTNITRISLLLGRKNEAMHNARWNY